MFLGLRSCFYRRKRMVLNANKKFFVCLLVLLPLLLSVPVFGLENETEATTDTSPSIIINESSVVISVGEKNQLTYQLAQETENDSAVIWKSSNDDIATVDDGLVTGIATGKAIITVSLRDDPAIKASVTVSVKEEKISLEDFSVEESSIEIKGNENYQLKIEYRPKNATERPKWSSEDEKIATVDDSGNITGTGIGRTRIVGVWNEKKFEVDVVVNFSDVNEDKYYYEPVYWALENGITSGMTATDFMPDSTCTRAQIVTFLWKINGSPEPDSSNNPFKDVSANRYYFKPILWAYQTGLTTGTSNNTFSPDRACSRAQVVQFIWGCQKNKDPDPVYFSDVKTDAYYYHAVKWAYHQKITAGTSKTTFSPNSACSRGQIVTFLYQCRGRDLDIYAPEKVAAFNDLAAQRLDQIGWDLKTAFNWSFAIPYYGHNGLLPEDASPGAAWYAEYGFKNKKGNCYVKASTFCEMAKMLGYDAHLISGYVRSTKGRSPHSWVEIDQDGRTYVYDLTSTSGGKSNGFKIVYGTKGTWQYIDYYRMN